MIFHKCASILAQCYKGVGVGGGEEGGKKPQVKTRGHQLPSDGPDHSTQ